MICGLRYKTRGTFDPIKFMGKDVWAGADSTISVVLRMTDLADLRWITTGETIRNQTTWVDWAKLDLSFTRADGTAITEGSEMDEKGIGKCSVRFTVATGAVDKVFLYGGIVPFDLATLEAKVREAGADPSSPNCPTVALKLLVQQGRSWNGRPMDFLPTEQPGPCVGAWTLATPRGHWFWRRHLPRQR